MIDIFSYFSYHEFLEGWLENQEGSDKHFSQRDFLLSAGIKGSSTLQRIRRGNKIPRKYIENFICALDLKPNEAEYFRTLIAYEDAKEIKTRGDAFSSLLKQRSIFPHYQIDDRSLQFFKRWYYPIIREVVHLLDGSEDWNKISRMVTPPITTVQAQNAVLFLEKHGFLKRNKKGRLERTEPVISTGARRKSGLLASYHQKNLEINSQAMDLVDKELLSLSSLTVCCSKDTYQQMRNELADFRNRMLELARRDKKADQVFHLNFTFMPRSRSIGEKED